MTEEERETVLPIQYPAPRHEDITRDASIDLYEPSLSAL